MKENACELCNKDAAVYCPSDSAFLCSTCDVKVHQANFLVARHIRHAVCCFTGNTNSSAEFHTPTTICPTTSTTYDFDDSLSSTSDSSACISSTTSPVGRNQGSNNNSSSSINKKRRRSNKIEEVKFFMAEGILVNWCGKLGVREFEAVVRTACSVLRVCLDRGIVLPFRVFLVASMWLGLEKKSAHLLARLEEVTGVPAKVILAAESKMGRALRGKQQQQHNRRLELEEGWDES